jgi:hypothetical protein
MMSGCTQSFLAASLGLALVACGGGESVTWLETETSSIQLELTTLTASGNSYRLGPATFDITGGPELVTVSATGSEAELHVPLETGSYEVVLRPGWVLQHLHPVEGPEPIAATLVSPATQFVQVQPFTSAPVTYAFHLGESGIDIGIEVEEGVPPGFDGLIRSQGAGSFIVLFANGGGSCCFSSVSEAQQAYPTLNLYVEQ